MAVAVARRHGAAGRALRPRPRCWSAGMAIARRRARAARHRGPDTAFFPTIFVACFAIGLGDRHRVHAAADDRHGRRPAADAGLGSGIVNVSQQLSGALGLAVAGHDRHQPHARAASGSRPTGSLLLGYHLAFTSAPRASSPAPSRAHPPAPAPHARAGARDRILRHPKRSRIPRSRPGGRTCSRKPSSPTTSTPRHAARAPGPPRRARAACRAGSARPPRPRGRRGPRPALVEA